jgi:phage tail-like protein
MATSTYGLGEKLYELLPAICELYDTKGELRRFLEIFGHQIDLIRSFIEGARYFSDLDECDGGLLPFLAHWIGWQTNFSLDLDSQRNEIRYAPELYKTVGIVANLRAFLNNLTSWDCQIKEFVHNTFLSNNQEQLNLWSQRLENGDWTAPELVSLDFAYEGAPFSFVS